jgi:cell wall-associated NlpC family hydrolase
VTTCTWIFRRHAGKVLLAAGLVAATAGLVVPRASADQISDLRAQAAALSSRIQALGLQEETLSERYDQAVLEVQVLEGKVAAAGRQLTAAQSTADRARSALRQDAIDAYVNGNSSPLVAGTDAMSNATDALLRAEYVNTLAANQNDTIDQYHLAALQERQAQQNFAQQTSAAQAEAHQVAQARSAVEASQAQLEATLKQDTGRIAVLVAQQQAAAAAAARRAAEQRLAAEQAAALAARQAAQAQAAAAAAAAASPPSTASASSGGQAQGSGGSEATPAAPAQTSGGGGSGSGGGTTLTVVTPPPVGSGASGAVAAAESRVGDWYQWGAAGPTTFDCSGLVLWAYAQVGVSLPHFSGAQYADTTHIPMSDLQPGDLVFPGDPGQHVAMYVGGGMIVEAPYTGAQVHVVPMGSWFVLASRVE